ncbi:MAG TPA: 16S rRNA (guanine(966)-N(2))-methyltransferase RsmD [Thermoanaerobaculia bacterium]|nr:16S rRNA (guanine(966)-N(2))-methyltransferase RsmD [Thermoanaerobaculia bacterium]
MKQGRPVLRIGGGALRGRSVAVPPGARPTEGRVREALFSIWSERVPGARFLDLFAGSGAVGIEAASRGAARVLCLEDDPRAVRTLRKNVEGLGGEGGERRIAVWRVPLPRGLSRLVEQGEPPYDLVFADPPYAFDEYEELLRRVAPLVAEDGEAAVEHSAREPLAEEAAGLTRVSERRYGETALSFYRRREPPS